MDQLFLQEFLIFCANFAEQDLTRLGVSACRRRAALTQAKAVQRHLKGRAVLHGRRSTHAHIEAGIVEHLVKVLTPTLHVEGAGPVSRLHELVRRIGKSCKLSVISKSRLAVARRMRVFTRQPIEAALVCKVLERSKNVAFIVHFHVSALHGSRLR